MKTILSYLLMGTLFLSFNAFAKDKMFKSISMETPFQVNQTIRFADLLPNAGLEMILAGKNSSGKFQIALYTFSQSQNKESPSPTLFSKIDIPDDFLFFDIGNRFNQEGKKGLDALYFFSLNSIMHFNINTKQFDKILTGHSMYLQPQPDYFQYLDFVMDLNGDGKDDIIIQDFHHIRVNIQKNVDSYIAQNVDIPTRMIATENNVSYHPRQIFSTDMNMDGSKDIVFFQEGKLLTYLQNSEGQFAQIPQEIKLNLALSDKNWWELKGDDGENIDQSHVDHQMFYQIKDLNHDGISDLVTLHNKIGGVFKQTNDYEIFFGKKEQGKLSYPTIADSIIHSDGTQFDLSLLDLNDDGILEAVVSSVNIGVSQIVGALLTGSIDQDVHFFQLNGERTYPSKPNLSRETQIKFSLSSGTQSAPVVKVVDFNGDGIKDLMLKTDKKTLKIYSGVRDSQLFTRSYVKQNTLLPSDGNMLITSDLNQDGKQDVVIRYGKEDEISLKKQLTILFAQ